MNVNVVRIPTMATILKNKLYLPLSFGTGWSATVTGSGSAGNTGIAYNNIVTGATASSTALLALNNIVGLNFADTNWLRLNWSKELWLFFIARLGLSDAEAVARVQLKETNAIGVMGEQGIGFQFDNLAVKGESYGASVAALDLATTLTAGQTYYFYIHFTPTAIEWFINGVLKGTQTTAAKIPTTAAGSISLTISAINGITGTVNYGLNIGNFHIVQAK